MVEARDEAHLLSAPLGVIRIAEAARDDLEGHGSTKRFVSGAIHDGNPATTNDRHDAVALVE